MDVRGQARSSRGFAAPLPPLDGEGFDDGGLCGARTVGALLGQWREREVRVATSFFQCRGMTLEEIEELYQEAVLVLLSRRYEDEEHLRRVLHLVIKQRASRRRKDEHRHNQILQEHARNTDREVQKRRFDERTDQRVLEAHDRVIIAEFLTALNPTEQQVFALMAEGMAYRAIANVLQIPVNEARQAARACERKRERFQLLYDTGRLCGYRANTIHALLNGEDTSEELAQGAIAHLTGCVPCQREHETNASRLRAHFRGQAVALLPSPQRLHNICARR